MFRMQSVYGAIFSFIFFQISIFVYFYITYANERQALYQKFIVLFVP